MAAAPLAEVPRLLVAQRRTTLAPDALLWRLGLVTVPAAGVLAALVIPFGTVTASRMSVGVVWFNAMEVLTWAGLWMAGWGANSVLSLVGGYRFVAQGLAYELPLMFALICGGGGGAVAGRRRYRRRSVAPVVRGVDAGRVRRLPGQRVRVQFPRPVRLPGRP